MKKQIFIKLFFLFPLFLFIGCQSSTDHTIAKDQATFITNLKSHAKEYSNEEYQEGLVPYRSYIKMTGKITKIDAKTATIQSGDRFVLGNDGWAYHVIQGSDELISLYDTVTVYGEYAGIIQAQYITKEEGGSA